MRLTGGCFGRAFIRKPLVELAKQHPDVEILVRKIKQGKAAVLRGHYGGFKSVADV
jgi:hypothetical protein